MPPSVLHPQVSCHLHVQLPCIHRRGPRSSIQADRRLGKSNWVNFIPKYLFCLISIFIGLLEGLQLELMFFAHVLLSKRLCQMNLIRTQMILKKMHLLGTRFIRDLFNGCWCSLKCTRFSDSMSSVPHPAMQKCKDHVGAPHRIPQGAANCHTSRSSLSRLWHLDILAFGCGYMKDSPKWENVALISYHPNVLLWSWVTWWAYYKWRHSNAQRLPALLFFEPMPGSSPASRAKQTSKKQNFPMRILTSYCLHVRMLHPKKMNKGVVTSRVIPFWWWHQWQWQILHLHYLGVKTSNGFSRHPTPAARALKATWLLNNKAGWN